MAAGVYAGAEGLRALVVEDLAIGGQAGTSSRIENYMGFPTGISGADLVWRGEVQAMKFGTRFAMPRRVAKLERLEDGAFCATFDNGQRVRGRAVVVATGVQYRRLPIDRLEAFEGAGVYYAATEIEARYCRNAETDRHRRRQLRRAGGDVPQPLGPARSPPGARAVARGLDVAATCRAAWRRTRRSRSNMAPKSAPCTATIASKR